MQAASPFSQWWAQRLYELRVRTGRGTKLAEHETRQDVAAFGDAPAILVTCEGEDRACPAQAMAELRRLGVDIHPRLPLFDDE